MTRQTTPVGPTRQLCSATSTRTGEPCRNHPMRGGTVCHAHGGRAPQVRAAAARRQVAARAERAVLALDPDARSGDWIDAMERVLARLEGMEEHIRGQLEELEVARIRQHGAEGGEAIHALVVAYTQVLDRLGTTAHRMGQLDLESVRVRIEARQHEAVAEAVRRALERAELEPSRQEDIRGLIADALADLHKEGTPW